MLFLSFAGGKGCGIRPSALRERKIRLWGYVVIYFVLHNKAGCFGIIYTDFPTVIGNAKKNLTAAIVCIGA